MTLRSDVSAAKTPTSQTCWCSINNVTDPALEHKLSSLSTANLQYDRKSRRLVQRLANRSKVDMVPVTVEVSWESYQALGYQLPKSEVQNRSTRVQSSGVADTGCTVLCLGPELMRKLMIPKSDLASLDITLRAADGRPLTVLGAIPQSLAVSHTQSPSSSTLCLSSLPCSLVRPACKS